MMQTDMTPVMEGSTAPSATGLMLNEAAQCVRRRLTRQAEAAGPMLQMQADPDELSAIREAIQDHRPDEERIVDHIVDRLLGVLFQGR